MGQEATKFLDYYTVHPWIQGVLTDYTEKRNNFLQGFFNVAAGETTPYDTVNFDRDFSIRNVVGQFVDPKGVQTEIQDRGFDGINFSFSYFKEPFSSPEYIQLLNRMPGQQIGDVQSLQLQFKRKLDEKVRLAYMAKENLHELVASQIILNGAYSSKSEKHKEVIYNFQRPVLSNSLTYADVGQTYTFADATERETFLDSRRVSQVDLTTLVANGGAGKRAWGSTGGTKDVSPYADVTRIVQGNNETSGTSALIMSYDAYLLYAKDPLWEKAADNTKNWATHLTPQILPTIQSFNGLMLIDFHIAPGASGPIPIYIYNGEYVDRTTGLTKKFIPPGYVIALPSPSYGRTVFGKIMHRKAWWEPMPVWMNYWTNDKDGGEEWEMHSNFVMGHTKIQDLICWKVK